ncbi:alpha/beta fold hydrolase [Waterburya agarophytonicola K14]|uniref:Alpha/beta fold hydrolase n=1 Tax=Waterburya agarophytonicola KI4 TaxID=2874699 RepID=A0A964BRL5_9CYAN|nr:alpha/beta fold hydrolase [Waterburya agarophytonicola]MCC0176911.1 alpha/beta fold hydrolase [Waterburya agarophytonicola KI4]
MSIKTDKIQVGEFEWFYRQTEINSDRTPVLFLHGLPSHSYTWIKMMSLLADENIPSIAPDWLGCGFSDKPKQKDFAYTPDAFLTSLGELIAALKLEKFYLVVQGFLSSVGVQYALENPEQIEGLIILNTPIISGSKLPWVMKQLSLPFVGDMMTQDPLLVDRTIEKGSGFVVSDKDLDVLRKPFLQSSAVGRSLMAILKKIDLDRTTQDIETGLNNWSQPTLIIWGTADSWLNADGVKKLAESNPEINLIELAEAKHYPQEHWASDISQAIVQFFRSKVF